MSGPDLPFISVLMPVRNEEAFIGRAIDSVISAGAQLGELGSGYEVIVIDGMSDDETRREVAARQAPGVALRVLDNPQRTVPHAMNLGIAAARGDVIIRLDGHAEMAPAFMAAALRELAAHPECACVGGPIENVDLNATAATVSAAMSSPFGVGNARFRTGGSEGYVDTLAFGAYRRADLEAVGLFDEELVRNQDDELNFRLVRSGRKIWFSLAINSRYYVRSSLRKVFRQYFQYGYWKVYVNRKHGTVTNLRQLAPPLLVATVVVLALAGLFVPAAWALLGLVIAAYLIAALYFASRAGDRSDGSLQRLSAIVLAYATLHAGYGLGYLSGMRDFLLLRRSPSARSAELSR